MKRTTKEDQSFRYRCPACHYLVEKTRLFGQGCPVCGWMSPLEIAMESNARGLQVDVVEDDDIMRVTAELPAANENSIKLEVAANNLLISFDGFNRIIPLRRVAGRIIGKTYTNGVLEVKLERQGDESYGH